MADAFKCDRCKKLYEGYYEEGRRYKICKDTVSNILDLCRNCNNELRDWMAGGVVCKFEPDSTDNTEDDIP